MAIPTFDPQGGLALSKGITANMQARSNVRSTDAATRQQRLQTEEFILNAKRRKAERSLGEAKAESDLRLLPIKEEVAKMTGEMTTSEKGRLMAKLNQQNQYVEQVAQMITTVTPDTYQEVISSLGPEQASKLGLKPFFQKDNINDFLNRAKFDMKTRRIISQSLASQKAGSYKETKFVAVSKDGLRTAPATLDPQGIYWIQDGLKEDGTANRVPLDTDLWDIDNISTVTNVDGSTKLTTTTTTNLQKKLVKYREQSKLLTGLAKTFTDEYLTTYGKILGYTAEKLDAWGGFGKWIDMTQKAMNGEDGRSIIDWNANRSVFTQAINRFFNAYRHDITGAQASLAEIELLKGAILNEDMGPAEAMKSITTFMTALDYRIDSTEALLRKGFIVHNEWTTDKEGNLLFVEEHHLRVGNRQSPTMTEGSDVSKMTKKTLSGGTIYYVEE